MTLLITSDLHLTDSPRDSYRFGLFTWLAAQQKRYQPKATLILGDLCDRKDRHSAALVNQIVEGVMLLRPPVYILMGNHDYVSASNPFFGFLSAIEGLRFIATPEEIWAGFYMIPHCNTQDEFNRACGMLAPNAEGVCTHACFDGSLSESGTRLSGLRWPLTASSKGSARGVWAGDVHRPQRHDNGVTYVGAPYHVRFGDAFNPRVLLVKDGAETDLHYPAPRKWSITVTDYHHFIRGVGTQLVKGDQVKIELVLPREELHEAGERKKQIVTFMRELGAEVHGFKLTTPPTILTERAQLSPQARTYDEILTGFGKAEALSGSIMQVGRELIRV